MRKNLLFFLTLLISLFFIKSTSSIASSNLSWTTTANLPVEIASNIAFYYNGKIYSFGGGNSDIPPLALNAPIQVNGELGSWSWLSTQSPPNFWHSHAIYNNNVYLLGGATLSPFSSVDWVYKGTFDNNGNIPTWNIISSLPKKLSIGNSIVVGNKLYYAGGFTEPGSSYNKDIYFTEIQPDGSIGNWQIAGQLPEPLAGFGFIQKNNKVYIIGGNNNTSILQNVRSAPINSNGTVGSWTELQPLPLGLTRSSITQNDKTVFVLGGGTNSTYSSTMYYADFNNDGGIGTWQSDTTFPRQQCCSPLVEHNNYLYLIGGHNGNYFSDVYFTKISFQSSLNVPLLKQTSDPWQSQIYDHANKWSPANPTINAYGCALTSAAMVFQYHGIEKLPDNETLDPGTLNAWLKSQKDGYIGDGLINWLALSRLSKKAKQSGHNPNFSKDALEFRRVQGMNNVLLTNDLNNGQPDILQVPGHFVVAKGIQADTFTINDPFYNRQTLHDGYSNTYGYIGRFIPSNTDLSYMLLAVDEAVDIVLKDSTGESVGTVFTETPINNAADNTTSPAKPLKTLYYETPPTGDYTIVLSSLSDQPYTLQTYLYNTEGEAVINTLQGVIGGEGQETFSVAYDPESVDNVTNKDVTFQSIREDIAELRRLNMITSNAYTRVILALLNQAEKNVTKGRTRIAKIELTILRKMIPQSGNKIISADAANILLYDINQLLKSL